MKMKNRVNKKNNDIIECGKEKFCNLFAERKGMKRIISLLLCMTMIFGSIPAVIAAPVMDYGVESTGQPGLSDVQEDEVKLATEKVLPAGIESTHSTYGDLIYFDDFGDGCSDYFNTAVVGSNAAIANKQLAYVTEGNWGSNIVDNPAGDGKVQKLTSSTSYNGGYTGYIFKLKDIGLKFVDVTIAWDLYFPEEATETFKIRVGDTYSVVSTADYTGSGTWQTVYMPMNGLGSFADTQPFEYVCGVAPGTVYYIDNIRVYAKAMDLSYATKPADYDETMGNLVFFYNGNAADTINEIGAKLVGAGSTGVYDGYNVTYTTDCTALLGSCSSHGIAIAPEAEAYTKNGKITLIVEQYNNMTNKEFVRYTALSDTQLGDYSEAWGGKYVDYSNTVKTYPGNWYTLKATADTANKMVGFFEREWVNHANLTRGFKSVAVYYMPVNYVKLTEGDSTKILDLGTETEYTVKSPENTAYNAWKDADGRIYLEDNTVASGTALTAITCDINPIDDAYGTLIWYDNFDTEGSQNTATYINTAWDISHGGYNLAYKAFGTEGEHKYLKVQSYWYGGFKLTANNNTGVPGNYTLVVDYKWPSDTSVNNEVTSDKAWMSFNESALGGDGYRYPARPTANTWGTMADTFTVETGSTFTDAMFRGGTTNKNVYYYIDNISLYFLPLNYVKLVEGSKTKLVDLQSATTYTVTAPTNTAYNAWKDADGKYYLVGDSVNAGTTLTAVKVEYAQKPADYDETMGNLVFFYNGNAADTINEIGAKLVGAGSTGVYDGFNVTYTTDCTAFLGSCTSHGIAIAPEAETYTKNGKITLIVEQYNNMTNKESVRYTALSGTQLGTYSEAWSGKYVDYSNTVKTYPGNWYTLKATADTANKMVGFFEREWVNHANLTRGFKSVAVYCIPENHVKLIDGESTKLADLGTDTNYIFPPISSTGKNAWKDEDGNAYIPGEKLPVADCKGKTYTAAAVVFDEISTLEASATAITEDNGTITVKPVVRYSTGVKETDFSEILYYTDTANATIARNSDGSLTVTGQINGDITITAIVPDSIKEKLSTPVDTFEITINVSGQKERIVSSTFKVMMFGNSIRAHAAAPDMGWYGETRGMAASSIDKDYAHRFIYYMNEKYGDGAAELVPGSTPDRFENMATTCAEYNAEVFAPYIESFKSQIVQYNPDIITVQLGENGSGATSENYAKVMTQLIKGIQQAAPNAIVVMSTPFWSAENSALVKGTYATAKECGIEVAPVNTLGQGAWDGSNPNMAFGASWITSATTNGVKAHPGDEGMDKIAKLFFEKVNLALSESFDTEYTSVPTSVEITNTTNKILTPEGTLALSATVLPADASQDVVWSLVSDKAYNYATISEDGVVTAINNQTVTVRATSRFKDTVYDEFDVEISGQTEPFTVTYDGNAADATVPAPNEFAKQGFNLTNVSEFANRPTYKFLGWALTPDGEVVDALTEATTDTTVYAQWEIAHEWDFERKGYLENFSSRFGFHQKVTEGLYSVTATGTTEQNAVTIISPELNLNSNDYYMLVINMRNAEKASNTEMSLTVYAGTDSYTFSRAVTSTDFTDYRFDLSGVPGIITGFEIKPTNVDCEVQIEEIKFLKNGSADYAEKPAPYDDTLGILVFFDNGNADDKYVNINADLVGYQDTVFTDGYYARDIKNRDAAGISGAYGIGLETTDKTTFFAYADGTDFTGTIRFYLDMYSTDSSNLTFRRGIRPANGWESWCGVYTDWTNNRQVVQNAWTTMDVAVHSNISFIGLVRNANSASGMSFRRAYAYHMPQSFVKFMDDGELKIVDLNGLDTFTFPESENGNHKGWRYGSDTEYLAMDTVPVSEVANKVFTSFEVDTAKVVYDGVSYEYVRYNGVPVQYTVRTDNYPLWDMSIDGTQRVCVGWSETENSDTTVQNVIVPENGITLYPVWEKTADAVDYTITASGETSIEIDSVERTYTYTAGFSTALPDETVVWTVSDETVATIDENGVLTPLKSGSIRVIATAAYYPFKSAYVDVVMDYKEGFEPVNVTFEGDVTELPASFTVIPGRTVDLSDYINMSPKTAGMRFNGWVLNGNTAEILHGSVTAVTDVDMVFTAVVNHDFNFAVPQKDNKYYNNGTFEVVDGMLKLNAGTGSGTDTYLALTNISIPASRYSAIEYYMDVNYNYGGTAKTFTDGETTGELYVTGSYSGPYDGQITITDDGKYAVLRHDLSSISAWSGNVTLIRNDFVGGSSPGSYGVRYIRFIENNQTAEDSVSITGITAPVTGYAPDETASVSEDFATVNSVTWSCADGDSFLASGKFNQNTAYTVSVKLTPDDSRYIFNKNLTATVNGNAAQVVYEADGTVTVKYTFGATDAFLAFDASISGNSTINVADRAYEYKFNVSGNAIPDTTATWSIDNTDLGVISADSGKLVARKNGTVTITAVSNYNPSKSATFTVVFSGINEVYHTLSFDSGTQDTVTGMPASMTVLAGVVDVPETIPERSGYVFLGWTDSKDSTEPVDRVAVSKNTTLYALWGSGIKWDFNGTKEGFSDYNGASTLTASNSYLIVKTTSKEDVRLQTPALTLDPKRYSKVVVRFAVDTKSLTDVFYEPDGGGVSSSRRKTINHETSGLDNWQTLTFDFSEVSGWNSAQQITKLWIDLFQSKNTTAYLDYIMIFDETRTVTYDAGAGTLSGSTPSVVTSAFGSTVYPTAEATLAGYTFVGWSTKADGSDVVGSFTLTDNITLYAVYGDNLTEGMTPSDTVNIASLTLSDGEALLIETRANAEVTINYTAGGVQKTWIGTANHDGLVVAALETGVELTGISITSSANIENVTKTTVAAANGAANRVFEEPVIGGGSSSGSGSSSSGADSADRNKVETVTKPGEIIPVGDEDPSQVGSIELDFIKEGDTLFNFDKAYQDDLFTSVSALEPGFETDSVISYRLFSKNSSAVKSPEMIIDSTNINADEKKYIIIRARHLGLDNPNLRIYFTRNGETEYSKFRSVRRVLTNEYTTLVYDMSQNKYWNGTIDTLRLTAENNSAGTIDIDWMMITDKLPEDTEYLNEAKDIFETARTDAMPFDDVAKRAWYFGEISQAYRLGFVSGKSADAFAPDDSVTIAEAITVAVRLNCIYYGKDIPEAATEGKWYDTFVEAAIGAKIIGKAQFSDYGVPATRRDIAMIMAKALPASYLEPINVFKSIPDVEEGSRGLSQILLLYNAGVVVGSDAKYNFRPDTEITRAELAAIVNRLALPGARKRVYSEDERMEDRKVYEGSTLGRCSLWSCENSSLSVDKDGYAWATSSGTDPIVLIHTMSGSFDGRDVVKIRIGVKWDKAEVELTPHLYYATSSANSFSGSRVFTGVIGEQDENGVAEVVFDVKKQSAFADTITQLRFDPFEVTGKKFAITYIIIE